MTLPVALTIAGSDPGGGAGIQADLRTFASVGVAGLSVITALTVQNSQGVVSVHPVDAEIVAAQLETLLNDTRPNAIKIGMLGGAAQVRAVAGVLKRFNLSNIVLDPVLASTGGIPLLDHEGQAALIAELAPLCALVTPNTEEYQALSPFPAVNILVTGGHRTGSPTDVLHKQDGTVREYSGPRIETLHTHGTGCFLSSAIAGYLAQGQTLENAVASAKHLITEALQTPLVVGQGRGCPAYGPATRREPRTELLSGVYVLTDAGLRPDRSAEQVTRAALHGGARIIQLREKQLPTPQLIEQARQLTHIAHEHGALLLVNDRVDIALASGADGVHLGPDDMRPRDARRLLGPDAIIGVSVSTIGEACEVAAWATYLGVGAIYGTSTKADAGPAIGIARLREIKAAFPALPIAAIGGINAENIAEVSANGAAMAAVVSAIVCAPDMADATTQLIAEFVRGKADSA